MRQHFFAAILLLTCACNSEPSEYEEALSAGSVEVLEAFIKSHPGSPYLDSAEHRIDQILFAQADSAQSLFGYYAYLATSKERGVKSFVAEAESRIDSLRFDSVIAIGTEDSYSGFHNAFPKSRFWSKARALSKDTVITGRLEVVIIDTGLDANMEGHIYEYLVLRTGKGTRSGTNRYYISIQEYLALGTGKGTLDVTDLPGCRFIGVELTKPLLHSRFKGLQEIGGRIRESKSTGDRYIHPLTIEAEYIKQLE